MPRSKFRVVALTGLAMLLLAGCGRGAAGVITPKDDETTPDAPGYEEPGGVIFPGTGAAATGGTSTGRAPVTNNPGSTKAPAAGSALRPLPKPTPIPGYKAPEPADSDPAADMQEFVDLLGRFGYDPGERDVQNVRMQVAIANRVPAERFHWIDNENLGKVYATRVSGFPNPPSYEQWKANGLDLASRYQGVSYYVGRRALYRDILRDRYNDTGSDAELVIYKRLNRSNYFVSYRADGRIEDFGYFVVNDWREFLEVPGAFWQ